MQGDHERETESQQQRVGHPWKENNNKESVTPESQREDQGTHGRMGKQKVNNKESLKKP